MTKYADNSRLEPEVAERLQKMMDKGGYINGEEGDSASLHSIAISLKRIADMMDALILEAGKPIQTRPTK